MLHRALEETGDFAVGDPTEMPPTVVYKTDPVILTGRLTTIMYVLRTVNSIQHVSQKALAALKIYMFVFVAQS